MVRNDDITASTVVRSAGAALTRAFAVLAGSTLVAHQLAARSDAADQSPVPDYPTWLVEALSPTQAVQAAVGRTLVLVVAALAIGALLGLILGWLRRRGGIGPVLSAAEVPILAVALPGVALYPAIDWLTDQGVASADPGVLGQSFGAALRFAALWSLPAALVVATVVASAVGAGDRRRVSMVGPGQAMGSAVPEPRSRWHLGAPTVAVTLALAASELLSGLRGVFTSFFAAVTPGSQLDLVRALDLVLWSAVALAAIALVMDMAGRVGGRGSDNTATSAPIVDINRALVGLGLALMAAVGAAAVIGAVQFDGADVGPVLSGPVDDALLGTDDGGRNSVLSALSALASTGLAALIGAVAATFIGALLALLAGRSSGWVRWLASRVIDFGSWPVPLMMGLGVVAAGLPQAPTQDPTVIAVAALALVPMAAALLGRLPEHRRPGAAVRWWPTAVTTVLYLWAIGLAAHVVIGMAGLGGGDPARDLGDAVMRAAASYDTVRWPYLAAGGAVAVGVAAILAAAIPLVGSLAGSSVAASWRSEQLGGGNADRRSDQATDELTDKRVADKPERQLADGAEPANAEPATTDAEPVPAEVSQREAQEATALQPTANGIGQGRSGAAADQPAAVPPMPPPSSALAGAPQPAVAEPSSARPPVETVSSRTIKADEGSEADTPDDDEQTDGGPVYISDLGNSIDDPDDLRSDELDVEINLAVLASVTRTVELRPSALRRAGITRPPRPSHRMTPTSTWSKPALATRPAPSPPMPGADSSGDDELPLGANLPDPPELPDPPAMPGGRNGEPEDADNLDQERRNS